MIKILILMIFISTILLGNKTSEVETYESLNKSNSETKMKTDSTTYEIMRNLFWLDIDFKYQYFKQYDQVKIEGQINDDSSLFKREYIYNVSINTPFGTVFKSIFSGHNLETNFKYERFGYSPAGVLNSIFNNPKKYNSFSKKYIPFNKNILILLAPYFLKENYKKDGYVEDKTYIGFFMGMFGVELNKKEFTDSLLEETKIGLFLSRFLLEIMPSISKFTDVDIGKLLKGEGFIIYPFVDMYYDYFKYKGISGDLVGLNYGLLLKYTYILNTKHLVINVTLSALLEGSLHMKGSKTPEQNPVYSSHTYLLSNNFFIKTSFYF